MAGHLQRQAVPTCDGNFLHFTHRQFSISSLTNPSGFQLLLIIGIITVDSGV